MNTSTKKTPFIILILFTFFGKLHAQDSTQTTATGTAEGKKKVAQKDMGDVAHRVFTPHRPLEIDTVETKDTKTHFSVVPAIGYTLQTGFAGLVSANWAYYRDTTAAAKLSTITTSVTYSQYNQTIVPLQMSIWTPGNKMNFILDWRFIDYPSDIYGLGGKTDPNKGYTIDFKGLKLHQTLMFDLSQNFYAGVGYFFDKFWDIKAVDPESRAINKRVSKELGTEETASGPAFRFLYDSRQNQLNPQQGLYYNMTYRTSFKGLGSDSNWQSLQIDARTYLKFPANSKNVLAFWMFDWLTLSGTPSYLLLPSTGWDDNYNTGRGYIQGRFRGKSMLYFESEYRFGITRDGLLGGVAFVNLQNFSADISPTYNQIFPGYGVGLRLKLNKHSGANLCVDYGFGKGGSQGFFVNLGEVF
jgi:hypothetical protein